MMFKRPRGPFGRLRDVLRGMIASWLRDRESDNPRAVYEQAIEERVGQYGELKQAVAGILYMRNKLEREITDRRAEMARLEADIGRAVQQGDDEASLALVAAKQALGQDLERAERELGRVRTETEDAKTNLVRFHGEIRALEREKMRALVSLASAQARRRIQQVFEGFSVEGEMRALEGVREHIARLVSEGHLEREVEADGLTTRLEAIRAEARTEAARQELGEIKRRLLDAPAEGKPRLVGLGS